MTVPVEALNARVEEHARRLMIVEDELRSNRPVVLDSRIKALEEDVRQLAAEVKSLRGAVVKSALAVAGSVLTFALTVIYVWGGGSG